MNNPITVEPVTTARELQQFIMFPYRLYRKLLKNPFWAPPLIIDEKNQFNHKKNPFYRHAEEALFLAYRDKEIVGRIAGYIDLLHHKYREPLVAYFGFFETIPDETVAHALFDKVCDWAKNKGMHKLIGPINQSTNDMLGMLINDFNGVPMVKVPYNPDYYLRFTESYGFEKEKDHLAFIVRKGEIELSDKIKRVVNLVQRNKRVLVRQVDMKHYWDEVKIAKEIYNKAWENNSDFVPWQDDEFMYKAKDLKLAIIPEATYLAFVDGKPAGISISLNNFNEIFVKMNGRLLPSGIFKLLFGLKKIKQLRLAIMGVLPEYRQMGLDAVFVYKTYETGIKLGYEAGELSVILEDNWPLINLLNKWGVPVYRTYRVYRKKLT